MANILSTWFLKNNKFSPITVFTGSIESNYLDSFDVTINFYLQEDSNIKFTRIKLVNDGYTYNGNARIKLYYYDDSGNELLVYDDINQGPLWKVPSQYQTIVFEKRPTGSLLNFLLKNAIEKKEKDDLSEDIIEKSFYSNNQVYINSIGLVDGSTRNVIATWKWYDPDSTLAYLVKWQECFINSSDGNEIWGEPVVYTVPPIKDGDSYIVPSHTYEASNECSKVRVSVKLVPPPGASAIINSMTIAGIENDVPLWWKDQTYTNYKEYSFVNDSQEIPEGYLPKDLEITEVTEKSIKISVDISDIKSYAKTILFRIQRDNSDNGEDNFEDITGNYNLEDGSASYFETSCVTDSYNNNTLNWILKFEDYPDSEGNKDTKTYPDAVYRVYCRAKNQNGKLSKEIGPTQKLGCPPKSPKHIDIKVYYQSNNKSSICLDFASPKGAKSYTVQYLIQDSVMTPQQCFDSNLQRTTLEFGDECEYKYTEIKPGDPDYNYEDGYTHHKIFISQFQQGNYYLRIKTGKNESSKNKKSSNSNDWSDIIAFSIGPKASSPSISSSTENAYIGESVILSWVHNSKDGSRMSKSKLFLYEVNSDDDIYTVIDGDTIESISNKFINKISKEEIININDLNINDLEHEIIKAGQQLYLNGWCFELTDSATTPGQYEQIEAPEFKPDDTNRIAYLKTNYFSDGSKIEWRVKTAGPYYYMEKDENDKDLIVTDYKYSDFSEIKRINIYDKPDLIVFFKKSDGTNYESQNNYYNISSYPFYIYLGLSSRSINQYPIGYSINIIVDSIDSSQYEDSTYEVYDKYGYEKTIVDGQTIYSKAFDTNSEYYNKEYQELSVPLSAIDINLKNYVRYKLECVLRMSSGLEIKSTKYFLFTYNSEADYFPSLRTPGIIINKDLSATLYPCIKAFSKNNDGSFSQNILTDNDIFISVYRKENDGSLTEIASNIQNGDYINAITDPHPSLDYARYRIIAQSRLYNSISCQDMFPVKVGEKSIVLQWSEKYDNMYKLDNDIGEVVKTKYSVSMVKIPYNIDISSTYTPDVSLIEYIGRNHPVSYYGTQKGESVSVSCEIPKDDTDTIYKLRRLAKYMGDVYFREPSGLGYWSNVKVSFSQNHCELTVPITLEITRIEGGK